MQYCAPTSTHTAASVIVREETSNICVRQNALNKRPSQEYGLWWRWARNGSHVRRFRAHPCNCLECMQRFQSSAEFLQGRFRNLCSTAIALGKQEHCIRKLPAGRIIGQSAIDYDARQCWPSDVKCFKQAV